MSRFMFVFCPLSIQFMYKGSDIKPREISSSNYWQKAMESPVVRGEGRDGEEEKLPVKPIIPKRRRLRKVMDHQIDEELGEKSSRGLMMEVKKTRKRKPDIEINMNANPYMRSCNSSVDDSQERNLQEENNHKSETVVANGINLDDLFSQFAFKGDVARPRGSNGKHWRESVKSSALSSRLWNDVKKLGRTEESDSLTINPAFPRLSQEKICQTCYEVKTDILEKGTADQNLKKKVDAESRVDPNDFQTPSMRPKGKDDRMDPIIKKNNEAHEEDCLILSSIRTSMGQPAVVDDRKDMKIKLPKVQKLKKRKKNAHAEVRVVSPYFQIPVGQPVVVAGKRDSKTKLTMGQELKKEEDAEVRVVSPYFQIPVGQPVVVLGDRRDSKARLPKGQKLNKKTQAQLQLFSPYLQIPVGQPALTDGRKSSTPKSPKPRPKSHPKVLVVSPYFHPVPKDEVNMVDADVRRTKKPLVIKRYLSASQKRDNAYLRKTSDNTWVPPRSPFGLLQEDHAHDPWRVLVICMLLNCTTGVQVKRVIKDFFALCPDAEAATITPAKEISKVIETLGLHKRAVMIKRLSEEYLGESWTHVTQLHGVGKYAADAYAIFCTGAWRGLVPLDHMLEKYFQFLESSIGRGRRRFC